MSIVQTPAGYTFTIGTKTYGPFQTREEAAEPAAADGYDHEYYAYLTAGLADDEIAGQ